MPVRFFPHVKGLLSSTSSRSDVLAVAIRALAFTTRHKTGIVLRSVGEVLVFAHVLRMQVSSPPQSAIERVGDRIRLVSLTFWASETISSQCIEKLEMLPLLRLHLCLPHPGAQDVVGQLEVLGEIRDGAVNVERFTDHEAFLLTRFVALLVALLAVALVGISVEGMLRELDLQRVQGTLLAILGDTLVVQSHCILNFVGNNDGALRNQPNGKQGQHAHGSLL